MFDRTVEPQYREMRENVLAQISAGRLTEDSELSKVLACRHNGMRRDHFDRSAADDSASAKQGSAGRPYMIEVS
jgi:hypothetical protein